MLYSLSDEIMEEDSEDTAIKLTEPVVLETVRTRIDGEETTHLAVDENGQPLVYHRLPDGNVYGADGAKTADSDSGKGLVIDTEV